MQVLDGILLPDAKYTVLSYSLKKVYLKEEHDVKEYPNEFLISSFRRVLNVACFHLGNSPASEVYMPTFRNTLSVPSS